MFNTVTLRKLGGSTVVAIPPDFLDSLKCSIGDEMELRLKVGVIEVRPKRKRLSLSQRLAMYKEVVAFRTEEEAAQDRQWDRSPALRREA